MMEGRSPSVVFIIAVYEPLASYQPICFGIAVLIITQLLTIVYMRVS